MLGFTVIFYGIFYTVGGFFYGGCFFMVGVFYSRCFFTVGVFFTVGGISLLCQLWEH